MPKETDMPPAARWRHIKRALLLIVSAVLVFLCYGLLFGHLHSAPQRPLEAAITSWTLVVASSLALLCEGMARYQERRAKLAPAHPKGDSHV